MYKIIFYFPFQSIRSEGCFEQWWKDLEKSASVAGVDEPSLPRKRIAPKRFDGNNSTGSSPGTPQEHYRAIYFEALDTVIACIKERFEQESYSKLEQLIIKGDQGIESDELFILYKPRHQK